MKLTLKQENFCNFYIETGNASEAYRRAYAAEKMKDESINRKAKELMDNGNITARIKELQGELKAISDITKERVLEELSAIAFADIRDYVVFNGRSIRFKPFKDLTDRQAKAIESIKKGKNGIELRLHGKSWTIERICRMLGFDAPQQIEQVLTTGLEGACTEELKKKLEKLMQENGNK